MGSYSNGQKSYLKLGNELETHVTTILIMNWLAVRELLANNINKDFGGSVVHLQLLTFLFFCCLFFADYFELTVMDPFWTKFTWFSIWSHTSHWYRWKYHELVIFWYFEPNPTSKNVLKVIMEFKDEHWKCKMLIYLENFSMLLHPFVHPNLPL